MPRTIKANHPMLSDLTKDILARGVENVRFKILMRPLRIYGPIVITSSQDEEVMVECVIDESRYKVRENYKIGLKSLDPRFGSESFYICDLEGLMERNPTDFIMLPPCPITEDDVQFAFTMYRQFGLDLTNNLLTTVAELSISEGDVGGNLGFPDREIVYRSVYISLNDEIQHIIEIDGKQLNLELVPCEIGRALKVMFDFLDAKVKPSFGQRLVFIWNMVRASFCPPASFA